jgi:hypothetical protein
VRGGRGLAASAVNRSYPPQMDEDPQAVPVVEEATKGGRMKITRLWVIAALAVVSGCAALRSHGPSESSVQGFSYYLPMRLARFTVERYKVEADAQDKLAKAKVGQVAAIAALAGGEAALAEATRVFEDLAKLQNVHPEQLSLAQVALSKATVGRDALNAAKGKADAAVAAAQLAVAAATSAETLCGYADRASITLLPPTADPSRRFVIEPKHWWTRKDELQLKTTAAGLLNTVTSTVTDETAGIIVGLASGRAAVRATGGPVVAFALTEEIPKAADECKTDGGKDRVRPWKVERVINPANRQDLSRFATEVTQAAQVPADGGRKALYESRIRLDMTIPGSSIPKISTADDGECDCLELPLSDNAAGGAGIAYRRDMPVVIDFVQVKSNAAVSDLPQTIGSIPLEMPNISPVELLPMKASLFTQTQSKFEFKDGMLLSWDSTRPSELGRVAAIPVEYARSIISLPAEIIQLRVNMRTNEKGLIESDTAALEAELKRLQAIKALKEAADQAAEEADAEAGT